MISGCSVSLSSSRIEELVIPRVRPAKRSLQKISVTGRSRVVVALMLSSRLSRLRTGLAVSGGRWARHAVRLRLGARRHWDRLQQATHGARASGKCRLIECQEILFMAQRLADGGEVAFVREQLRGLGERPRRDDVLYHYASQLPGEERARDT